MYIACDLLTETFFFLEGIRSGKKSTLFTVAFGKFRIFIFSILEYEF
jgi:hypothetical protein